MQSIKGFSLLELVVTLVIIGILATLGFAQYGAYRETALNKEAQSNLRLIMAAERVYRMEVSYFYNSAAPPQATTQPAQTDNVNDNLRLLLSTTASRAWNYRTTVGGGSDACAQATRNSGVVRNWRMRLTDTNPVYGSSCP